MDKTEVRTYFENKRNLLSINKYQALEIFADICDKEQMNLNLSYLEQCLNELIEEKKELQNKDSDKQNKLSLDFLTKNKSISSDEQERLDIITNNIDVLMSMRSKYNMQHIEHDDIYNICKDEFEVEEDKILFDYLSKYKYCIFTAKEINDIDLILKKSSVLISKKHENSFDLVEQGLIKMKEQYENILENFYDEELENSLNLSTDNQINSDDFSKTYIQEKEVSDVQKYEEIEM